MTRFLTAIACVLALMGTAHAQSARWTSPSGLYSIALPNWPESERSGQGAMVREIEGPPDILFRACAINEESAASIPGLTQTFINERAAETSGDLIQQMAPGATNGQVTHFELNGVLVLDVRYDLERLHYRWRTFYVVGSPSNRQVMISCGIARSASAAEIASVDAILETLLIP